VDDRGGVDRGGAGQPSKFLKRCKQVVFGRAGLARTGVGLSPVNQGLLGPGEDNPDVNHKSAHYVSILTPMWLANHASAVASPPSAMGSSAHITARSHSFHILLKLRLTWANVGSNNAIPGQVCMRPTVPISRTHRTQPSHCAKIQSFRLARGAVPYAFGAVTHADRAPLPQPTLGRR
jgi:hypothetical protein